MKQHLRDFEGGETELEPKLEVAPRFQVTRWLWGACNWPGLARLGRAWSGQGCFVLESFLFGETPGSERLWIACRSWCADTDPGSSLGGPEGPSAGPGQGRPWHRSKRMASPGQAGQVWPALPWPALPWPALLWPAPPWTTLAWPPCPGLHSPDQSWPALTSPGQPWSVLASLGQSWPALGVWANSTGHPEV